MKNLKQSLISENLDNVASVNTFNLPVISSIAKMPPPAVDGCTYEAPLGVHTREACSATCHPSSVSTWWWGDTTSSSHITGSKLGRLPTSIQVENDRVALELFKIHWNGYISRSPVTSAVRLMQLHSACDDQLGQRVFYRGSLSNAELLIKLFGIAFKPLPQA